MQGDYGKPRPALVIQSDLLPDTDSVLICLITSKLRETLAHRLDLPANNQTGLREPSQIMTDKIMACPRTRCGLKIGQADKGTLQALAHLLMFVTGITEQIVPLKR